MEGAIVGAVDREEAEVSEELLGDHECLGHEVRVKAKRIALMHIEDWGEAQEADPLLTTCRRQLCTCKDTPFLKRDTLLKKYFSDNVDMEEGHALFHMHNGLVMNKGLLYINTMPKGEAEGILAFLIPTDQLHVALSAVHCDAGYQGQQRTLAFTQEKSWWPMMVEDR